MFWENTLLGESVYEWFTTFASAWQHLKLTIKLFQYILDQPQSDMTGNLQDILQIFRPATDLHSNVLSSSSSWLPRADIPEWEWIKSLNIHRSLQRKTSNVLLFYIESNTFYFSFSRVVCLYWKGYILTCTIEKQINTKHWILIL